MPSIETARRGEFRRIYRQLDRRCLLPQVPVIMSEGDSLPVQKAHPA